MISSCSRADEAQLASCRLASGKRASEKSGKKAPSQNGQFEGMCNSVSDGAELDANSGVVGDRVAGDALPQTGHAASVGAAGCPTRGGHTGRFGSRLPTVCVAPLPGRDFSASSAGADGSRAFEPGVADRATGQRSQWPDVVCGSAAVGAASTHSGRWRHWSEAWFGADAATTCRSGVGSVLGSELGQLSHSARRTEGVAVPMAGGRKGMDISRSSRQETSRLPMSEG
jgi:hypothetical protein